MTDLATTIQAARDDCEDVQARLDILHEDYFAHEWRPESVSVRTTPRSSTLWDGLEDRPVQACWTDVIAELHRASWVLARNTDVPAAITPGKRVTGVLAVAKLDAAIVAAQLAWCHRNHHVMAPPECGAVLEACGHVSSARGRLDDFFEKPRVVKRCVRRGCEGADGQPKVLKKSDGRICSGCRSAMQRARAG